MGGVFYSISIGMPTGIAALIVTLQPILTNILSGPILNEKVTFKQWTGAFLGFVGAALVLGLDLGGDTYIWFNSNYNCFDSNNHLYNLAKETK